MKTILIPDAEELKQIIESKHAEYLEHIHECQTIIKNIEESITFLASKCHNAPEEFTMVVNKKISGYFKKTRNGSKYQLFCPEDSKPWQECKLSKRLEHMELFAELAIALSNPTVIAELFDQLK